MKVFELIAALQKADPLAEVGVLQRGNRTDGIAVVAYTGATAPKVRIIPKTELEYEWLILQALPAVRVLESD